MVAGHRLFASASCREGPCYHGQEPDSSRLGLQTRLRPRLSLTLRVPLKGLLSGVPLKGSFKGFYRGFRV